LSWQPPTFSKIPTTTSLQHISTELRGLARRGNEVFGAEIAPALNSSRRSFWKIVGREWQRSLAKQNVSHVKLGQSQQMFGLLVRF
jgi:hypothetical protein